MIYIARLALIVALMIGVIGIIWFLMWVSSRRGYRQTTLNESFISSIQEKTK